MPDTSDYLANNTDSTTADKIQRFISRYPLRTYDSGQIILFANEDPEHLFYTVSGLVIMYDVSPRGNEVVANVYEPGRFFPFGWALNETPNHYFYKAENTTRLRLVPRGEALEFVLANPDVTRDLLSRIYHKIDRLFERMIYLMSATATRRLLYEISAECRQFGKRQPDGSHLVPVREIDLAVRSGLSRETVSREFQKFKEQGMVRLEKDGVRIRDLEDLERHIGAIP